jgi:hypothetical protein
MSKHVSGEKHHEQKVHAEHGSHSEHKVSGSDERKFLGVGVTVIALLVVIVIVVGIVSVMVGFAAGSLVSNVVAEPRANLVDKNSLKTSIENYFAANSEAIFGSSTVTLSVIDINSEDSVGGLYSVKFELSDGSQSQQGTFYANDKKVIVSSMVFDLSKPLPKPEASVPVSAEPVKSDKPVVDLYVMSFCPYGNKAEDTMLPVYALLKDKIEFNVHYIVGVNGDTVSSLHGAPEVAQNEREACVLKYYDLDKWFSLVTYVNANCGSSGSCWETGAQSLGIDKTKIEDCVSAEGVDLMRANEAASNAAGASGSPTMIVNGVKTNAVYQYGNSDAYKQFICDSFNVAPSECSVVLSATATSSGGSCGS